MKEDVGTSKPKNYYIHYYKNVFAHKCYCYDSNTFSFSASMLEYTNVHV